MNTNSFTNSLSPQNITNLWGEPYREDDYTYIMSREKLHIKINEMCSDLMHPLTIMNLNYDECEAIDVKCRIDSTASVYALRKSCWNLRTYIGESNCTLCDYYHAKLCAKLISGNGEQLETPDYFSDEYKQPILKSYNGVKYLQYNCPMLGFIELCFPIYFKNKIIGVMFLGELLLNGKEKSVNKMQKCFLEKNEKLFDDYTSNYYNLHNKKPLYEKMLGVEKISADNKLAENILKRDLKIPKTNLMEPLSDEEFQNLIKNATNKVKEFEDFIEISWNEKQRKLLNNIIIQKRFHFDNLYKQICDKSEITYIDVQDLFYQICKYVIGIKDDFKFTYCRIFENLPIVQATYIIQEFSDGNDCPYSELKCDFKKCNLRISTCKNSYNEPDEGNPIKCFSNNGKPIDKYSNIVFACKNIAIIFGVDEQVESFNILVDLIGDSIQHICGDMEYIASTFTRIHHESTLRMYKHECEHLAVRIEHNNNYYEKRESYEALSDEKHKKIFNDIKSTAVLLQQLSLNIGLIQGTVNINSIKEPRRFVDIRDEFNKWRAMFRLELPKKNIRLLNATKPTNDGIKVYAYESLLVLLLYNIIDNAVKYSYWGTNIRTEIKQGKITIEDYGMPIDESNKVYDLYYRSPNARNNHLGDGIGLYSSSKIAKLLNVDLKHECELVSSYHIPFLIEAKNRGIDLSDLKINYEEIMASIDEETLKSMLIDPDFHKDKNYKKIPPQQLKDQINFPTYKVKFTINNFSFAQFS